MPMSCMMRCSSWAQYRMRKSERGMRNGRMSSRSWLAWGARPGRIHRYTLDRLRKEIRPVTAANFLRFLYKWQGLATGSRAEGREGLAAVLDVLDGYELAAGAWESEVLPARLTDYDPLWLDGLCLSGEIAWGRLTAIRNAEVGMRNRKVGPVKSTPIALFRCERGEIRRAGSPGVDPATLPLSSTGKALLTAFESRGALFFGDLVN